MTKLKTLLITTTALSLPLVTAAAGEVPGGSSVVEIALYALYALTLAIIFAVIYNFWSVITSFGGIVGKGLNLIGSGVILFSAQIVLRILGEFGLDYLRFVLRDFPRSYEIFHASLQVISLLLVVWGLKELASVYQKEKRKQEDNKKSR